MTNPDCKKDQPERFASTVRAVCGWSECPYPDCPCGGSAMDAERAINAWEADLSTVAANIYACCESTLIGFRNELTEQQIKFICDQVSCKSVWRDDGLNEDGSDEV
jgi:hypothetical protein